MENKNQRPGNHDGLEDILADVQAMVEDGEMERAGENFQDFYDGIREQIRIEDQVLFPLYDERTGIEGPTRAMRREHEQIQDALDRMREAIDCDSADAFSLASSILLSVLPIHNAKEENLLYIAIDEVMEPPERAALIDKLRKHEL